MYILQIEHEVPNYDGWKKAFDSDPINRKQSGVKSYRIYRPKENPGLVIVELDFENIDQLNTTLQALQDLWNKVQGTVIAKAKTKILEIVESKDI
ncbi:MAG: hypothetical protein IPG38_13785 [Chitinophagaceae bacterium]|nr:hypothetical protein [Chitinophagaceae bacterium]MBK9530509.1 hypothetical protein [Chitinophagaceae bacterium]